MADAAGGRCLIYRQDLGQWCVLDVTATGAGKGFAGSVRTTSYPSERYRPYSVGFWSAKRLNIASGTIETETIATSVIPWTWASPLIDMSQEYQKFTFGGFIPMARGPAGLSPATLTWTIYGGSSPYNMRVMQSGTYDYSLGASALVNRLGQNMDEAFLGIVLTGSNWIELAGVLVYDAASQVGR